MSCWYNSLIPASFSRSVGLSICLSVGNNCDFWKNGRVDEDAFGLVSGVGPRITRNRVSDGHADCAIWQIRLNTVRGSI